MINYTDILSQMSQPQQERKKILIVDDEADLTMLCSFALEYHGSNVYTFNDPREAATTKVFLVGHIYSLTWDLFLSATYLAIEVPSYLWIRIFMYINERNAILLLIGAIIATAFITTHPAQAETGKGDDVFRVIMTIFGVDKSRGDVVAIVTVNNGVASKVRFLDSDTAASGGIIEYVATFPNVTVNAAEPYEACVVPVKTLEPICTAGNNSPASRPEFVDISLNATTTGLAEDGLPEDVGGDEEE